MSDDSLPPFMESDANLGKERITAHDCVWMGDACDNDPDEWLKVSGCDPRGPLEMLLMAVIAAHPWSGIDLLPIIPST
jgi:hypothetical protein